MTPQPDRLVDALRVHAHRMPAKIAFRFLDARLQQKASLSYSELYDLAVTRAAAISACGLAGQTLVLPHAEGLEFVGSFFGALLAGCVVAPINPRMVLAPELGLENLLRTLDSAAVLVDVQAEHRLLRSGAAGPAARLIRLPGDVFDGELVPTLRADDLAIAQFTSGSTGQPKGVAISNGNLLANAKMLSSTFNAGGDEVVVSWLPLFHDMGLMTGVVWPVVAGATSILLRPSLFAAKPLSWLLAIDRFGGTISSAPDFAYKTCAERFSSESISLDLSRWRIAICGAEPVRAGTVERFLTCFEKVGFRAAAFYPAYGLAEATLFVSGGRSGANPTVLDVDAAALQSGEVLPACDGGISLVSNGLPAEQLDLRIVDPETIMPLDEGRVGEIWLHGPSISQGSFEGAGKVTEAFAYLNEKAFLRTGDLGFLHNGELFVTGRSKDLIILRGANYAPQDIEETVQACHPALGSLRAAAFAVEAAGEAEGLVVVAEARCSSTSELDEVAAIVCARVAEVHGIAVRAIGLVSPKSLPLTSSGKLRRQHIREAWYGRALKLSYSRSFVANIEASHG